MLGLPRGSEIKNSSAIQKQQEIWVQSLDWEDPLKEEMTTHSSILAWKITWTEDPGRVQSMELRRVERRKSEIMWQRFRH